MTDSAHDLVNQSSADRESRLPTVLESILFVHGEPMALALLARTAGASEEDTRTALAELALELTGRGVILVEGNDMYQLGSHPDHARYIEALVKSDFREELSRSALETLAVVAYKGPISRAHIEYIRGVNSSFILRSLMMRGLIERAEDLEKGQAVLYQASIDMLKHLGLVRAADLPRYEELSREPAADPMSGDNSQEV